MIKAFYAVVTSILMLSPAAHTAEIAVYSGGAPELALRALGPDFEKASGHRITFTFAIVTALQKRLLSGEKADVIFMPMPLIAELEKSIPLHKEGRGPLARVGLVVIVREGAPQPDLSSTESFRKLLLSAKAIALSEATTPGGGYILRMFQKLGIADELKGRLLLKGAIHGGGDLVARGDADVGIFLASEMQSVRGVTFAGLLPEALRFFVGYGTAIPAYNHAPEPALAFIKFLTSPAQADPMEEGRL